MAVVLYATVQFVSAITQSLVEHTYQSLFRKTRDELTTGAHVLHEVFNDFLLILIGIELMETIRMYLDDHLIHVEVVLTVAIIAVAREAIDINFQNATPVEIVGTALLLLALTLGYYLFKRAGRFT
jgi:uncharacterized membrane protein (DUF373 family)